MGEEIGFLSSDFEKWVAQVADDAYEFDSWILELADGKAYLIVFRGLDNKLGVRVNYTHKEEIRNLLDEVKDLVVEGTEDSIGLAVDKFTNTLDKLINIPVIGDSTEAVFFELLGALIKAGVMAQINKKKVELAM